MGIPSTLFSDSQLASAGVERPRRGKGERQRRDEVPQWRPIRPGVTLLAIDPSIRQTGWAVLRNNPAPSSPTVLGSGMIAPIARGSSNRFDDLAARVMVHLDGVDEVVIELPNRGPAWKMGHDDIRIQSQAIGVIQGVCIANQLRVHLVRVSEWKGRDKKQRTAVYVKHFLGRCPGNDNEADALGIGLWLCSRALEYMERQ